MTTWWTVRIVRNDGTIWTKTYPSMKMAREVYDDCLRGGWSRTGSCSPTPDHVATVPYRRSLHVVRP